MGNKFFSSFLIHLNFRSFISFWNASLLDWVVSEIASLMTSGDWLSLLAAFILDNVFIFLRLRFVVFNNNRMASSCRRMVRQNCCSKFSFSFSPTSLWITPRYYTVCSYPGNNARSVVPGENLKDAGSATLDQLPPRRSWNPTPTPLWERGEFDSRAAVSNFSSF